MLSELLRKAFWTVPDIQVVSMPDDAQPMVHGRRPTSSVDVILMRSPWSIGVADAFKVKKARTKYEDSKILVLSERPDFVETVALFGSGANGVFCGADLHFELLCKSIRCVHRGEVWANNELVQHLVVALASPRVSNVTDAKGKRLLSNREQQVLDLLAEGLSNADLAAELKLSEHTVKNHLFRIYDKLGVSNRMEAVLYALTPRETAVDLAANGQLSRAS
jgi:DNA-binding NarL/FixJ family response regulator